MFRREDGKKAFSFTRLATNMFPNFASDAKDDVDVSPQHQDALFRWQLAQPEPKLLGELSFFVGGVVGSST